MPGGDQTGPLGAGPMTGRGAGICGGLAQPSYANRGGFGRGFGRGWRNRFRTVGGPGWQPEPGAATTNELDTLRAHSEQLEQSLAELRTRIDQLQDRNQHN